MRYDHIRHWLFDLDNTLYSPAVNLFGQIDVKMGAYIEKLLSVDAVEARRVQKDFFHAHGTTLRGLMDEHGVEPSHFLDFVHDIDLSVLARDERLARLIAGLPGQRLVFTNGDTAYATRVLERLGILHAFDGILCIHGLDYRPKPDPRAYETLVARHGIDPARAIFVEDMARNLRPAKAMGMMTVWVDNGSERGSHEAAEDYIDLVIGDVGDWLETVAAGLKETA